MDSGSERGGSWDHAVSAMVVLTWLRRLAASIPLTGWIIGGMALALAMTAHSAHRWHRRYDVAQASIDALAKAQRAANFAAVANKARVETAQSIVTKEADHATDIALACVAIMLLCGCATPPLHVIPAPALCPAFPQAPASLTAPLAPSLRSRLPN